MVEVPAFKARFSALRELYVSLICWFKMQIDAEPLIWAKCPYLQFLKCYIYLSFYTIQIFLVLKILKNN